MTSRTKCVHLPNGIYAYHDDPKSAKFLYAQVLEYFQHGVNVTHGMTVFDVGANVGLFALEVLRRCDGDVRLLCFEPAPSTYELLEKNVHDQFPDSGVKTFCCGLWRESGQATLYHHPRASVMSSLLKNNNEEGGGVDRWTRLAKDPKLPSVYRDRIPGWVKFLPDFVVRLGVILDHRKNLRPIMEVACKLRTISEVIREERVNEIDLLKVDVEGAELDVFLGIEDADWDKIKIVVVEVQDEEDRLREIREILERRGLRKVVISQDYVFRDSNIYNVYAAR